MSKLRVAIIGTGGISHEHMKGYLSVPEDVEIVGLCDIDEEKVNNYAKKYDVDAKCVYTDYRKMLAEVKPDAVSVCTWNAEHKAATIAALEAGANVLCEKPMAMNTQEALEMEAVAEKTGKLLMVGFVRRFGNDAEILTEFIKNGTLGDLYYAKATYLRRNGWPGGWFGDKEYSGGGPVIDLGVHVMDLVRYLAGNPKPVSVYAVAYDNLGPNRAVGGRGAWISSSHKKQDYKYNVEDFASAMIKFDTGLTIALEASFNLNIKQDVGNIELFGTKGGAAVSPEVEIFTDIDGRFVNVTPYGETALSFNGLFEREIVHFVNCAKNGGACRVSPADGVMLMRMIDAIYESAATGHEVEIKY